MRHGFEAMPTSMGPGVLVRVAAEILFSTPSSWRLWWSSWVVTGTRPPSTNARSSRVKTLSIRDLHINGAYPDTGVAVAHDCCWRSPTSPWGSSTSFGTCAWPSYTVTRCGPAFRSRMGKRTASDAGREEYEARTSSWSPAEPKHGARLTECARSEVGEEGHHQPLGEPEPPSGGLGRARVRR